MKKMANFLGKNSRLNKKPSKFLLKAFADEIQNEIGLYRSMDLCDLVHILILRK